MATSSICLAIGLAAGAGVCFGASPLPDPSGDAAAGGPDIVGFSGAFDAAQLHLAVDFAPGTFSAASDGFLFGLDIDENPATGVQAPAFFPLGAEFSVLYNALFSTTHARVFNTGTGLSIALAPVVFAGAGAQLSVPLLTLGNDDGLMRFGAASGDPVNADQFISRDFAPDSTDGGPLTHPTKFIPGPGAAGLPLLAAAALSARRRRAD